MKRHGPRHAGGATCAGTHSAARPAIRTATSTAVRTVALAAVWAAGVAALSACGGGGTDLVETRESAGG